MKNEYFSVADALVFASAVCLIASFISPIGLILVVAFGISAIISVAMGGANDQ